MTTLFRNLNPAKRDEAAVAGAKASAVTGFGYLEHFVIASPYAAGSQPSLADCALLPSVMILRKTAFPTFGLADPTAGAGPLGRWWSACETGPVTAPFMQEYSAAVDAFLGRREARLKLDVNDPHAFGALTTPAVYMELRMRQQEAFAAWAPETTSLTPPHTGAP